MLVVQSDCQVSILSVPGASVQINAMLAFFIKAKGYLYVSFAFNQALKNSKLSGQAQLRGYSKSRKKQSSGLRCFLSKPFQGLHQPLLNCAIVLFWCYTFKFCLLKFSLSSGSNYNYCNYNCKGLQDFPLPFNQCFQSLLCHHKT